MQLRLLRSAETDEATESLRLDGVGDNVAICICAKTWNVADKTARNKSDKVAGEIQANKSDKVAGEIHERQGRWRNTKNHKVAGETQKSDKVAGERQASKSDKSRWEIDSISSPSGPVSSPLTSTT